MCFCVPMLKYYPAYIFENNTNTNNNTILTTGTYPPKWSRNFLRPVCMKDDRKDEYNYGSKPMGSCLGKKVYAKLSKVCTVKN